MNKNGCRICLIEDDEITGEALQERFGLEGYDCDWIKLGKPALRRLEGTHYDVVISDIQLPDINGEAVFEALRDAGVALPPYLFITGYGTIDRAVRMLKLGAEDYLTKPLDIHALLARVRRLCEQTLRAPATAELGVSDAMRRIGAMLPRIARSTGTVLISGESGVGKEQVARALHRQRDPGANTPFVAINCGALTESLLEAELFGYVKGAFTGAARDKKGVFEQAHGGTLFLDEIGDMSAAMQVKLLRAIQERQIVRVGGDVPIAVTFNLVCATHRDLKAMVDSGEFREDLYYRIHVIHLRIPPLRERRDDILPLARTLLTAFAKESGGPVRTLDKGAETALLDYPWPGNVRELRHCLERACILHGQPVLGVAMLFEQAPRARAEFAADTLSDYLAACEKKYIGDALAASSWRIADTAAVLGISRKNLWEKMKKLGIQEN